MTDITYKEISAVNHDIKTLNIKGKEYAGVNQRILAFRKLYPKGRILTELLSNENGVCVFKATVKDENGNELGTGHAYEKESSSFINRTSYIENCETSAIGRAIGAAGIGIDDSIASLEEVGNVILNQGGKNAAAKEQTATPCEGCGSDITHTVGSDGKFIPAERVVAESVKRTGKKLCAECLKKAAAK